MVVRDTGEVSTVAVESLLAAKLEPQRLHEWLLYRIKQHDFMIADQRHDTALIFQFYHGVHYRFGVRPPVDVITEENDRILQLRLDLRKE